jgi:hypothetical protein
MSKSARIATGPDDALSSITHDDFVAHIGETVRISSDGVAIEAALVQVDTTGVARPGGRRHPFRLLYRGPAEPALSQRICRVEQPSLGALDLRLIPIGPIGSGMGYEAEFS